MKRFQMGSKTKKFADILLKAMQSANAGGFDYLSFRKNLKQQSGGLSVGDRYRAAFSAVAGDGDTLNDALMAARKQADVLQEEGQRFREVLRKQQKEKVTDPQSQAHKLSMEIEKKRRQMEQLQAELSTLSQEMAALQESAEEAADGIRETATDFQAALSMMLNQVQDDIKKIKEIKENH